MAHIVSGCPRSGTSLMMLCQRAMLGEDRIMGEKFPMHARRRRVREKVDGESDAHHRARQYMLDKKMEHGPQKERMERMKDMNPQGFWECPFTVQGLYWRPGMEEFLEEDRRDTRIIKVVSQGLFHSNPSMVDRVVMMLRHPAEVAKSQRRLRRGLQVETASGPQNVSDEFEIITPQMFIQVTKMAARFVVDNPDIPVHTVQFGDLIEAPRYTLQGVARFLGEGDWEEGAKQIEPRLYRSHHESGGGQQWAEARDLWHLLCRERWQDIVDYDTPGTNRKTRRFFCVRVGKMTSPRQCMLCYGGDQVTGKMRRRSEQAEDLNWREEPCLWECGYCEEDGSPKSIEESIEQNFFGDYTVTTEEHLRRRPHEVARSITEVENASRKDVLGDMMINHNFPEEGVSQVDTIIEEQRR